MSDFRKGTSVRVDTGSYSYTIHIENNFNNLAEVFKAAGLTSRKICVITDSRIKNVYLNEVTKRLENLGEVIHYAFPEGEKNKNLSVVQDMYKFFVENNMDRKSVVAALGGGVTGDIAGFAAATYMRGISFVQLPTSLLSQVDSSVGGKVGVDFMDNKNMVGAFYQPEFVYINTNTLNTLPPGQFASGMGEVIKHGLIQDKEYLDYIWDNRESARGLDENIMAQIVAGSCRIKAKVVSADEKEQGLRAILNFGHTFGHAVESLSGFSLSHGASVAIGVSAALHLSEARGSISREEAEKFRELLEFFDLPVRCPGYDRQAIYDFMTRDKKTKNNEITLILLNKIGEASICSKVPRQEIFEGIHYIIGE